MFDATKSKYRDITFQQLDLDDQANANAKSLYHVTGIPRLVFLDGSGTVLYNGGAPQEQSAFEEIITRFK